MTDDKKTVRERPALPPRRVRSHGNPDAVAPTIREVKREPNAPRELMPDRIARGVPPPAPPKPRRR